MNELEGRLAVLETENRKLRCACRLARRLPGYVREDTEEARQAVAGIQQILESLTRPGYEVLSAERINETMQQLAALSASSAKQARSKYPGGDAVMRSLKT